jgi:hypothetical protein
LRTKRSYPDRIKLEHPKCLCEIVSCTARHNSKAARRACQEESVRYTRAGAITSDDGDSGEAQIERLESDSFFIT